MESCVPKHFRLKKHIQIVQRIIRENKGGNSYLIWIISATKAGLPKCPSGHKYEVVPRDPINEKRILDLEDHKNDLHVSEK